VEAGLSPRIGINIGLWKEPLLRLRSSYGKSFRIPTFNDLYWIAGGNPSLRPERSNSFDLGALAEYQWNGSWSLDVSYFSIQSRNRILWTPTSGTFWSPRNISEVNSRGLELEGRWEGFNRTLSVTVASTWMKAAKTSEDFPGDPTSGKQLVYVPRQTVSISAGLHVGDLHLSVRHVWTSYRYTTEINDRFLRSFGVTDASARYAIPLGAVRAFVKLEATNIFGTKYQVLALYPMPLQEARVTVGGEL
jgi:iron complex outermembrane receptor protein